MLFYVSDFEYSFLSIYEYIRRYRRRVYAIDLFEKQGVYGVSFKKEIQIV